MLACGHLLRSSVSKKDETLHGRDNPSSPSKRGHDAALEMVPVTNGEARSGTKKVHPVC